MKDVDALLIKRLSRQERDRISQVHLAQARGAVRNGDLLRQWTDILLRLRLDEGTANGRTAMDDLLIGTLAEVVRALGDVGIAYAVTGSVASSVHGEPFASLDVDLVLTATDTQACAIARILSPRFYAPEDMLMEAAQTHTFANLVDNRTGVKVDLSFVPRTGFVSHAIERRVKRRVGSEGPEFDFVTPEDVILMKLLWRKDTLSQKQWENALGVVRVKTVSLDWKYLFEQARSLGIEDDLIKLRDEAGV